MIEALKQLLGVKSETDLAALLAEGAQIVDVRSPEEFRTGHVKGSLNIPLSNLERSLSKLKRNKPVIVCCASGMRSAQAKSILQSKGFERVYNAGSWQSLKNFCG
ncbi:MAG: sulfurtransferase [Chitinophagales bacterium]|nr:MAG: sulfurtransferase [Chitinophagales bacterium]